MLHFKDGFMSVEFNKIRSGEEKKTEGGVVEIILNMSV